jgi:uncharacterized membrane protein YsdA (DUF1294 family)
MTNFWVVLVLLLNMVGIVAVAMDKYKASHHMWRIPERFFFTIAALGASPGVYLACQWFRHKTKHPSFMWGIPAIFIGQLAIIAYFRFHS